MNDNHVLLINPPSQKIIEDYDVPNYGHLGLAYLASALRSKNIHCAIIDAKLQNLTCKDIINKIVENRPGIVGITSFTHEIVAASNLADQIKAAAPGVISVIGGVHASSLPRETLEKFKCYDYVVTGEGERTFTALSEAIIRKRTDVIRSLAGVGYRDSDGVHINPRAEWIKDLDNLQFPAWDLFPKTIKRFPVVSSRGCPFKCIFCARMMGEEVRARSCENVIKELEYIHSRFGARDVFFCDETFGFDNKRLAKFISLAIDNRLSSKIKWGITTRANLVDPHLLDGMKKAGCVQVDFGVESGDEEILKTIKKGETKEDFVRAAKLLREAGLRSHSYYIIGHPNETRRTAMNTIDFASKLNTDGIAIGIMIPYPGTEVAMLAGDMKCGYKKMSLDWVDYNKQLGNAVELEMLSGAEMTKIQLLGYILFYLRNLKMVSLASMVWQHRKLVIEIMLKYRKQKKRLMTYV